ncbi:MAG: hypothetical protein IPP85_18930 [Propionivibrio sp.]|nr:hypothetical protein [Propionivibrio sp.]
MKRWQQIGLGLNTLPLSGLLLPHALRLGAGAVLTLLQGRGATSVTIGSPGLACNAGTLPAVNEGI